MTLGLIVLMAQMGCFVPAEVAVIPVRDNLLSRIGTGDDMENNVSTFLMEMREVAQVGRGAAAVDGGKSCRPKHIHFEGADALRVSSGCRAHGSRKNMSLPQQRCKSRNEVNSCPNRERKPSTL